MSTQNTTPPAQAQASSGGGGRGGLLALLSVALVGGVMYSAYQFGKRPVDSAEGTTTGGAVTRPILAANGETETVVLANGPLRSAPAQPGGLIAPDQDRAAYESLGPRSIEPASARVTTLESAEDAERPLGPMTARAVDSSDSAALRARNTEIHSIGLAAVPPRADMARPAETFALEAPDRDLGAPSLAAALSSSSGGAAAPAGRPGPVAVAANAGSAGGAAPAPTGPRGPTLAAALQAQGGAPHAPTAAPTPTGGPATAVASTTTLGAPAGSTSLGGAAPAPMQVAQAAPASNPSSNIVGEGAPALTPSPRPRPIQAAAPSVVELVRNAAGLSVPATPATPTQVAAPAPVGFRPAVATPVAPAPAPVQQIAAPAPAAQPAQPRVFAPGEATMSLGQEFVAAAAGIDPRAAAAAQAQAQAQALEQARRQALAAQQAAEDAQRQALARQQQQQPQYYGAPQPYAQPQPQYAAAPQPAPAPIGAGGAQIQLGALPSQDQVHQRWAALQRNNPDLLGALRLEIQPVTTGAGQQLFRLRAGPLADFNSARNLCAALQARGVDCYAPRS